jgi:hypothetical protein
MLEWSSTLTVAGAATDSASRKVTVVIEPPSNAQVGVRNLDT